MFRAKKQNLYSNGNVGANGVKGSKFLVENVIFGIAEGRLKIQDQKMEDQKKMKELKMQD